MGFGLNYESTGGGEDFLPVLKYDARAGRFFRVDRQDGINNPVDITQKFKAVIDLENVEVGYIRFGSGVAPDFVMVPLGKPMPPRPSAEHKQGLRLMVKLGKECGSDVRELASTAKVCLHGLDLLHTAYEQSREKQAGQLPVIALKETTPITVGEGQKKSTNYQPVFEIVGWASRPADLVHKPRGHTNGAAAAPASNGHAAPPSTGSTQVGAPAPAPAAAGDAEDFG